MLVVVVVVAAAAVSFKLYYFDNGYTFRWFGTFWESTSASVAVTLTQKVTDTEYFHKLFKST